MPLVDPSRAQGRPGNQTPRLAGAHPVELLLAHAARLLRVAALTSAPDVTPIAAPAATSLG